MKITLTCASCGKRESHKGGLEISGNSWVEVRKVNGSQARFHYFCSSTCVVAWFQKQQGKQPQHFATAIRAFLEGETPFAEGYGDPGIEFDSAEERDDFIARLAQYLEVLQEAGNRGLSGGMP